MVADFVALAGAGDEAVGFEDGQVARDGGGGQGVAVGQPGGGGWGGEAGEDHGSGAADEGAQGLGGAGGCVPEGAEAAGGVDEGGLPGFVEDYDYLVPFEGAGDEDEAFAGQVAVFVVALGAGEGVVVPGQAGVEFGEEAVEAAGGQAAGLEGDVGFQEGADAGPDGLDEVVPGVVDEGGEAVEGGGGVGEEGAA